MDCQNVTCSDPATVRLTLWGQANPLCHAHALDLAHHVVLNRGSVTLETL